jgi:hypothetical protein
MSKTSPKERVVMHDRRDRRKEEEFGVSLAKLNSWNIATEDAEA